jgi:hypothetical protein
VQFRNQIKTNVFHIKAKSPLVAGEDDDVLSIFLPSIEFAEELSRELLKSISNHKKLEAEGRAAKRMSFTFTGNLSLLPYMPDKQK